MDESTEKLVKEISKRRYHSLDATKEILIEMDKEGVDTDNKITAEEMFEFVQKGDYEVISPREHSIKTMLETGKDLIMYFMQMDWMFMYAPKSTSFITCDNPFSIIPPKNLDSNNFWDRGVGIITPGAKKLIPLSSEVCLVMGEYGEKIQGQLLDRQKVRGVNNLIANNSDRYIVARGKRHLERIIKDTKVDKWIKTERIKIG